MTKEDIGNFLVIDPEFLKPVNLTPLARDQFCRISASVTMKACYNNALNAAIGLNGNAVILGVAVIDSLGFPVEHAWVEMPDGSHTDPTFQDQHGEDYVDKYTYYSLYRIPREKYLRLAKELSPGSQIHAISITCLRRWSETRHLFDNKHVRNRYELAVARHQSKRAQEDS